MAGQDGSPTRALDSLLHELGQVPYKFDFFQALRLLESAFPERPRWGHATRLSEDAGRFRQVPSLKFAPSSIADFEVSESSGPHDLSVHFFGLCGPNGALPLHLTEYTGDRIHHHDDHTLAAFFDVFHHRLLTLFYRVWADARPTVHFDRPETDRFSVYVGSLFGMGSPALRGRDEFPDLAKQYYVGHLACQARHPDGLQAMLTDFFGLPVTIDEFVGQWTEIPADYRLRLGEDPSSATLGVSSTLGARVWDCQQKFRITVGPLDWQDFCRLLPERESLRRFSALVRSYIGDELLWDLNLVLKRESVPGWELGQGQLGQTIWMDQAGLSADAADLKVQPTHVVESGDTACV